MLNFQDLLSTPDKGLYLPEQHMVNLGLMPVSLFLHIYQTGRLV